MCNCCDIEPVLCTVLVGARVQRGMSKAGPNFPIIILARQLVLEDLESPEDEDVPKYFADTPVYSFMLPDISVYPEDFKAFLYNDLVDNYTLVYLEQAGLCYRSSSSSSSSSSSGGSSNKRCGSGSGAGVVTVTVTKALVLRPLLEDRGHITESVCILVPLERIKQKCFQIAAVSAASAACSMLAVQQQRRLCR